MNKLINVCPLQIYFFFLLMKMVLGDLLNVIFSIMLNVKFL